MGAWGTGPFDNDAAADWAGDLDDAGDSGDVDAFVRETLSAGPDDDLAFEVVAAAAWLAAGVPGGPPVDESYGPALAPPEASPELRAGALAALDQVTAPGTEWHALWSESDLLDEALAALAPLRAALGR